MWKRRAIFLPNMRYAFIPPDTAQTAFIRMRDAAD
jgi:hypothetical protein